MCQSLKKSVGEDPNIALLLLPPTVLKERTEEGCGCKHISRAFLVVLLYAKHTSTHRCTWAFIHIREKRLLTSAVEN